MDNLKTKLLQRYSLSWKGNNYLLSLKAGIVHKHWTGINVRGDLPTFVKYLAEHGVPRQAMVSGDSSQFICIKTEHLSRLNEDISLSLTERPVLRSLKLNIEPSKEIENHVLLTAAVPAVIMKEWRDDHGFPAIPVVQLENGHSAFSIGLSEFRIIAVADLLNKGITAGAVVIESSDDSEPQCYIVAPKTVSEVKRWALPKGRQDDGESLIQTAQREIFEEAGLLDAEFINADQSYLGIYPSHTSVTHFYLMENAKRSSSDDSQGVRLVPLSEAINMLSASGNRSDASAVEVAANRLRLKRYNYAHALCPMEQLDIPSAIDSLLREGTQDGSDWKPAIDGLLSNLNDIL